MKCRNCKMKIDDNCKYCPNCGMEVVGKKTRKPLIIVVSVLVLAFLVMAMSGLKMKSYSEGFDLNNVSSDEFIKEVNKLGCEVIDVLETNPSNKADFYYVTDTGTCPYLISYTKFNDWDLMVNFYLSLISEVRTYDDDNMFYVNYSGGVSYSHVNLLNYDEYKVTTSDTFKNSIIDINDNAVFYFEVAKEDKEVINDLKETLGINYEMDYSFLNYLFAGMFILVLFMCVSRWKIFVKMGRKGWTSLIPIYNLVCLSKDVLGKKRYAWLLLVPFANLVFILILNFNIAKVFGKNDGYQVLTIFFSEFTIPLIAFDDSVYTKPEDMKKVSMTNNVNITSPINENINKSDDFVLKSAYENNFNSSSYEDLSMNENKKDNVVLRVIWNIFCWMITVCCLILLLGAIIEIVDEKIYRNIFVLIPLLPLTFMACPVVTRYTKSYEKYTNYKPLIVFILVIILFIAFAII